ncbi:MAG: flagellar export protein FliJ [Treponema sp.]|nr:flagellar export protein FliJ [Treponema sp.]
MKRFVFQLEDVMKYREFFQSQAEIELGKAVAAEHEIQTKLDEVAAQNIAVRTSVKGSVDFREINSAHNFAILLDQQKEYLLKQIAEAKIVSEQKRKILQDSMQKTEALHKLRERKLAEYHEAENKEEEDTADDITTSNFRQH